MAVSGFKGFGWLLGIATVSPACYMVSSQVAAERGRVEAVESAILEAKRDIRGLETEFDTRANLAQLERWNGDVLSLSAPRPDQYLRSVTALANFHPGEGDRQYASLVVPSATDVTQAVVAPVEQAVVRVAMPAKTPAVLETSTVIRVASTTIDRAPVAAPATVPARARPRVEKVAMVDTQLLSDATFGDLVSSARQERGRLR